MYLVVEAQIFDHGAIWNQQGRHETVIGPTCFVDAATEVVGVGGGDGARVEPRTKQVGVARTWLRASGPRQAYSVLLLLRVIFSPEDRTDLFLDVGLEGGKS